MSKYTALIQDLESSTESFNQLAKRHGHKTSIAHAALSKIRPDLLGPRSARLGFAPVNKTDIPDNIRAEALARVLAGESVKNVAQATGVPAPTLYQMARKARAGAQTPPQPTDIKSLSHDISAMELILSNIKQTAASMGTTPEHLCDLLKSHLSAK